MREIALHLLDIAENSVTAGAENVEIQIEEDLEDDRLYILVKDDGKGMSESMLARVTDPFVTTRTTRKVGLGIPLLKSAAEACEGGLQIQSKENEGTRLEVEFQRSHIDRMPLGDLAGTFLSLVIAFPEVHWVFRYRVDGETFLFDDAELKRELDGIPLTDPVVLRFVRETLEEGIEDVQRVRVE